jgi:hypothetical protein
MSGTVHARLLRQAVKATKHGVPVRVLDIETEQDYGWFREDSLRRIRKFSDTVALEHPLIPPGWRSRHPHPAYALGHRWAVSYEYQLLLIDLFRAGHCPTDVLTLAAGLDLPAPDESFLTYAGMVAYRQAVASAVGELKPQLVERLLPAAGRHGLDALPWGLGWLIETAVVCADNQGLQGKITKVKLKPVMGNSLLTETSPVDPRCNPAKDALLLYLWLSGAYKDGIARHLVAPFLPLGFGENPSQSGGLQFISGDLKRKAMRLKAELGARRPTGRPPGRSRWDRDELYFALASYMSYLANRGWVLKP